MFGFLYNLYRLLHPHPSIPPRSSSSTFSAYTPSSRLSINLIYALISLAYSYMYTSPHSVDHLSAALFCILYRNVFAY
jgi:hypothetical protein